VLANTAGSGGSPYPNNHRKPEGFPSGVPEASPGQVKEDIKCDPFWS
jgi:hypothetical protein